MSVEKIGPAVCARKGFRLYNRSQLQVEDNGRTCVRPRAANLCGAITERHLDIVREIVRHQGKQTNASVATVAAQIGDELHGPLCVSAGQTSEQDHKQEDLFHSSNSG